MKSVTVTTAIDVFKKKHTSKGRMVINNPKKEGRTYGHFEWTDKSKRMVLFIKD